MDFEFETTETIPPLEDIIGQERAVKALDFGLKIKNKGYNIYMAGPLGTGKTTYAKSLICEIAKNEPVPDDICYVYNFDEPDKPRALTVPAGKGTWLSKHMETLISELKLAIPRAFSSEQYDNQKNSVLETLQNETNKVFDELEDSAQKEGFTLKRTNKGIMTIPLVDGEQVEQDDYDSLNEDQKKLIEENRQKIQSKMSYALRKVRELEKKAKEKIHKIEKDICLSVISQPIEELKKKYEDFPKITDFFDKVQVDIIENLNTFKEDDETQPSFPWVSQMKQASEMIKYKVNVIVNNGDKKGAPVIYETNPVYYNLVGKVEHKAMFGEMTTDFTMIKSGSLHKANGGYLIIQALDVLTAFMAWDALKRCLKTKEITIENMGEQYRLIATASLKPDPVPLDLKVILIGSPYIYHILYEHDPDFRKLFKIKADFDTEMSSTKENMYKYAAFISYHCAKEKLKHFDRSAVAKVIEHSSRLTENQKKLSTQFIDIVDLIYEANTWATQSDSEYVTSEHVETAIHEKALRSNRLEEKIGELIEEGKIMVDTTESVVGQVNGIAIYNMGDYIFGKPTRITARTYMGSKGIVNIERESKLSGNIHDKGVMIINGYLGGKYAQDKPISLSASIAFEQSYGNIDGDSASITEVCALLSALSGLPIKQGIGVTGSINQRGEVQPVGAVTRKIEGFFEVCKKHGLTGEQGVIIPHQNVDNLMLSNEVIKAVKKGKFHVYAVKDVDTAVQILTGEKAGKKNKNGKYSRGTVNYLVDKKLHKLAKDLSSFAKSGK